MRPDAKIFHYLGRRARIICLARLQTRAGLDFINTSDDVQERESDGSAKKDPNEMLKVFFSCAKGGEW